MIAPIPGRFRRQRAPIPVRSFENRRDRWASTASSEPVRYGRRPTPVAGTIEHDHVGVGCRMRPESGAWRPGLRISRARAVAGTAIRRPCSFARAISASTRRSLRPKPSDRRGRRRRRSSRRPFLTIPGRRENRVGPLAFLLRQRTTRLQQNFFKHLPPPCCIIQRDSHRMPLQTPRRSPIFRRPPAAPEFPPTGHPGG